MDLENSYAAPIIDAPIAYFTVTITGAYEILFVWVEVQRHNRRRVSSKSTQ